MEQPQKVSSKGHDLVGQKRVAVIGTGLAGLTTAYLLRSDEQERYSVTLFEQVGRHLNKQKRRDKTNSRRPTAFLSIRHPSPSRMKKPN
jgi:malic enzyme